MKDRAKVEVHTIQIYEGHWADGDFKIDRMLDRSDLTKPDIKPVWVASLTNGDRILVGWTTKDAQRLFYVKEFVADPSTWSGFTRRDTTYTLKLIRMRGPQWKRTSKIVKRAMVKWFQGENFYSLNHFPLVRSVYPSLIANDLISIQPMVSPTSLILQMRYGKPKI